MILQSRQCVIDEILNGPLELADTGPLRLGDRCCFWGIACEAYRKATGNGAWVPREDKNYPGRQDFVLGDPNNEDLFDQQILGPIEVASWLGISPSQRYKPAQLLWEVGQFGIDLKQPLINYLQSL